MWIVRDWWVKRKYGRVDFAIDNITQTLQSDCLEDVKKAFTRKTAKKEHYFARVQQKEKKREMFGHYTDLLGRRIRLPFPPFDQTEVARHTTYIKAYVFFMILLVCFETYFLKFFGDLLLSPQSSELSKYLIGFVLAIFFAFSLHFALHAIFRWFNARYLIRRALADQEESDFDLSTELEPRKKVRKMDLSPFYPKFILGIIGCVLFIIANIGASLVRVYLLDPASTMENTPFKDRIDLAWHVFAIALPISLAAIMALAEMQVSESRERLSVHRNLKRQQKELLKYYSELRGIRNDCLSILESEIEISWSLMKDFHRIFGKEYDSKRSDLFDELQNELRSGSLGEIDLKKYQQYLPVASCYEPLFGYPIRNAPFVVGLRQDLHEKVQETEQIVDLLGVDISRAAGIRDEAQN